VEGAPVGAVRVAWYAEGSGLTRANFESQLIMSGLSGRGTCWRLR